jgi:hypothetical protein
MRPAGDGDAGCAGYTVQRASDRDDDLDGSERLVGRTPHSCHVMGSDVCLRDYGDHGAAKGLFPSTSYSVNHYENGPLLEAASRGSASSEQGIGFQRAGDRIQDVERDYSWSLDSGG